MADYARFPDPTYRDTVLAPLFDNARDDHAEGFRRIDRAHLVMLAETGILSPQTAGQIARALVEIDAGIDPEALVYDGSVEDYFFLRERELKAKVGPDTGGRLHTARSRNDIDHTLFKLALKARLDRLLAEARDLLSSLVAVSTREADTLIVAYTHGQPAQPTTLGHYLSAATEILIRDIERLEAARATCDLSSMGAAAITTTGFPIDRHRVAALLGFAAPQQNSYSCIAAVDYITGAYSALSLTFLHLGRLIQDLQFWSSFEVGQIHVPDAFVQISSIMPQKRNPVPIEHMRHLASQTVGRAQMMLTIMHNTPFTDMNDSEGESQAAGHQAFDSGSRVLRLLAAFLPGLTVNAARVAQNIDRSCITVTELADSLVREDGLSFRQAHEIAAATARAVVAKGESLAAGGYDAFAAAFAAHTGHPTTITEELYRSIVSPEFFVAVRDRFGGPAPAALTAALAGYRAALDGFAARAAATSAQEAAAAAELDAAFSALLEVN